MGFWCCRLLSFPTFNAFFPFSPLPTSTLSLSLIIRHHRKCRSMPPQCRSFFFLLRASSSHNAIHETHSVFFGRVCFIVATSCLMLQTQNEAENLVLSLSRRHQLAFEWSDACDGKFSYFLSPRFFLPFIGEGAGERRRGLEKLMALKETRLMKCW